MASIEDGILTAIKSKGRGSIFFPSDFTSYGEGKAVGKSLERLTAKGDIIGCYKGIVKEVVKITEQPKTDYGRKVFIGVEQLDSPYMGLDIRTIFHTLANFNTKYYNL